VEWNDKFAIKYKGHKNMKKKYEKIMKDVFVAVKKINPQADDKIIKKAWEFAKTAHHGQKRLSGLDFATHPLKVARILASWKIVDTASIAAALLHDTVEDGGATKDDIVKEFGKEIAFLVDGVTKITEIRLKGSREGQYVENLRKMLIAMAKDIRVVLIKLADRLHNMRTISYLSKDKQKQNARETLEIYAPLAERFGIGEVKGELEDLSFPIVYKKQAKKVELESQEYYKKAGSHLYQMTEKLAAKLRQEEIKVEIHARKKHLYSLWKKLERKGVDWDFNKINDIVALRIVPDSIPQCYSALGVVHGLYKPVPHIGVSDFIAQPKPNGYRSIHTKVFGPGDRIVEVQIRTREMHEQAEYGIAAHWTYSEEKSKGTSEKKLGKGVTQKTKLSWVKQLVDWQKEITDSREYLDAVKFDALKHRIFVFTPGGDVHDLPAEATPIDFAYSVHSDLGKYIKGARVDGKQVSLHHKLTSGVVVEIVKHKEPRLPSRDWLKYIVTTDAKREIIKQLRGNPQKR